MPILHRLQRHVNFILGIARVYLPLRHFFHPYFSCGLIPCCQRNADVSVSQHAADFLLGVHHRQESAVALPHEFRCPSQVRLQRAVIRRPRHHVFHFHGPSSPETARPPQTELFLRHTAYYFHRTMRMQRHGFADASHHVTIKSPPPVRAHHDQIRAPQIRHAQNRAHWRFLWLGHFTRNPHSRFLYDLHALLHRFSRVVCSHLGRFRHHFRRI